MPDPDVIFVVRSPLRRVEAPAWNFGLEDGSGVLAAEDGGMIWSEGAGQAFGLVAPATPRTLTIPSPGAFAAAPAWSFMLEDGTGRLLEEDASSGFSSEADASVRVITVQSAQRTFKGA